MVQMMSLRWPGIPVWRAVLLVRKGFYDSLASFAAFCFYRTGGYVLEALPRSSRYLIDLFIYAFLLHSSKFNYLFASSHRHKSGSITGDKCLSGKHATYGYICQIVNRSLFHLA